MILRTIIPFLALLLVAQSDTVAEVDQDSPSMVLNICGARMISDPTDEEIRRELSTLSTDNDDYFAILGPSDLTYLQVLGDKNVGFILEYQEGSVEAHFRATDDRIPLEQVVRAFIAYRDGSSDWQEPFTFEKITKEK